MKFKYFIFLSICNLFVIWNFGFVIYRKAFAIYSPLSVPNNKVGVHILSPDELDAARALVNTQGGDWGYVTVPIQPTDRDKAKWQKFMHQCSDFHLIPIVRITTIPLGGTWEEGKDTDLVDFANFLNELDWPIENRYIVLFNETNRDQEWGGIVNPESYAHIVKNAATIFKERSKDFFVLGPSLDSALPNSNTSMSASNYLKAMENTDPNIWNYFDGWSSHSYPNPDFSASPAKTGWTSIVSYRTEMASLHLSKKPVFITETGWNINTIPYDRIQSYWRQAFNIWNLDSQVVAVTPFVLSGGSQFKSLSLIAENGKTPSYLAIESLPKVKGEPKIGSTEEPEKPSSPTLTTSAEQSDKTIEPDFLLKIENFFRVLLGLLPRGYVQIADNTIDVEIAKTPRDWEKGLSGREHLYDNHGMLFVFPYEHTPEFWMKDMNFDIDIIWIKIGTIVDITKNVKRSEGSELPTYSPSSPVDTVLEVPAGYSDENNLQVGDVIILNN